MRIEIEVAENGYVAEVWTEDFTDFKKVFTSRDDLYRFLDPLLEIGSAKAGDDEPEEWNHV